MIRLKFCLAFTLTVGGCGPTELGVDNSSETQDNVLGDEAPTAFIQTFSEPNYPTPDTFTTGFFEMLDSCLVFLVDGEPYRAVMQQGTRLEPPSIVVFGSGARAVTGRTVTVKGAEGSYGSLRELPKNCPKKALLIGDLERDSADGD
jgi:hypothetical protein